ncbi:MAG: 60S ribosomal protein L31 [Candidatus Pacearchaeota archaeon]|nr:60S ribosomal protein L31 [Candidatus Pacearchaeota archaeon]
MEKVEKIYTIPLRKEWLKAPKKKRAKKAIKAIREFIARHMKMYDKNLEKIKISEWVNKAIWCRGIKNPPPKITVKATKTDDKVLVDFVGLPKKFKQEESILRKKIEKELKRKEKEEKKKEEKKEKPEEKIEKKEQKIEEEKEKILHKEVLEGDKKLSKVQKRKEQIIHRKVLEK